MLNLSEVMDPFQELNDLKRIYSAGHSGSIATRLFVKGWTALANGAPVANVTGHIVAQALAAARLGDIDDKLLTAAGVPADEASRISRNAVESVATGLLKPIARLLDQRLADVHENGPTPNFVGALARQPRAGITCPGKPRILLEPPENHAEHCLMVAVYGVLLSELYDADPVRVFLAAMAHHFHNAGLPDSGFTGEVLLGAHLRTIMAYFNDQCLSQLAPGLRAEVERARAILPDAETADGRAFHAADVIDRVLQLNQYTRAAALTPERMLGEMELVHAGPVKGFQDEVLREAGLL